MKGKFINLEIAGETIQNIAQINKEIKKYVRGVKWPGWQKLKQNGLLG